MADFQRPLLSATDEGQTQYGKKEIDEIIETHFKNEIYPILSNNFF